MKFKVELEMNDQKTTKIIEASSIENARQSLGFHKGVKVLTISPVQDIIKG